MATHIWQAQKPNKLGGSWSITGRSYPSHAITSSIQQLNLFARVWPTPWLVPRRWWEDMVRAQQDKCNQQTRTQSPGRLEDLQTFLVPPSPGPPSFYVNATPWNRNTFPQHWEKRCSKETQERSACSCNNSPKPRASSSHEDKLLCMISRVFLDTHALGERIY